ncbi:hypothetical protein GCM10010425_13090 [Streptomyces spororaveus]|uniref:Uncharacterized protein n=1 Tax=Streptomyces spororaveus TaxID=284039 RepID=A0ABQ3T536_9ACTN|nr:hypothetical protein Sspor_10210 [Streptomyces spororaveus]
MAMAAMPWKTARQPVTRRRTAANIVPTFPAPWLSPPGYDGVLPGAGPVFQFPPVGVGWPMEFTSQLAVQRRTVLL